MYTEETYGRVYTGRVNPTCISEELNRVWATVYRETRSDMYIERRDPSCIRGAIPHL